MSASRRMFPFSQNTENCIYVLMFCIIFLMFNAPNSWHSFGLIVWAGKRPRDRSKPLRSACAGAGGWFPCTADHFHSTQHDHASCSTHVRARKRPPEHAYAQQCVWVGVCFPHSEGDQHITHTMTHIKMIHIYFKFYLDCVDFYTTISETIFFFFHWLVDYVFFPPTYILFSLCHHHTWPPLQFMLICPKRERH